MATRIRSLGLADAAIASGLLVLVFIGLYTCANLLTPVGKRHDLQKRAADVAATVGVGTVEADLIATLKEAGVPYTRGDLNGKPTLHIGRLTLYIEDGRVVHIWDHSKSTR